MDVGTGNIGLARVNASTIPAFEQPPDAELDNTPAGDRLPRLSTMAKAIGGFATAGALLPQLRPVAGGMAGRLGLLRTGTIAGAAIGALAGAAALVADSVTDGKLARAAHAADMLSRDEAKVFLRNLNRPTLGLTAFRSYQDALAARETSFTELGEDGPSDAFRHSYGSALLALRLTRDGGVPLERAKRIADDLGRAHVDRDSTDDSNLRRRMDLSNNSTGLDLLGDARNAGEGRFLTDAELRSRVVEAVATGKLVQFDEGRTALVPTTDAHLIPDTW